MVFHLMRDGYGEDQRHDCRHSKGDEHGPAKRAEFGPLTLKYRAQPSRFRVAFGHAATTRLS